MHKTLFVCFLVIFIVFGFIGCGGDEIEEDYLPVLIPEEAGLAEPYIISPRQAYLLDNPGVEYIDSIPKLNLSNANQNKIGEVVDGWFSAILDDSLDLELMQDTDVKVTSNPGKVTFSLHWTFDYWPSGFRNYPYIRFSMRNATVDYRVRWILIYADKEGAVKGRLKSNSKVTFDLFLVEGWNSAITSGTENHFVTQKGFENFVPCYRLQTK